MRILAKKHCKDLKIKLAFTSFKLKNLIAAENCVPRSLPLNIVYKPTCGECNSVYVGETS